MAIRSGARVTVEPPSIPFSQRRRVGRIPSLEKAKKEKLRMEKKEKARAAEKLEKKAEIERNMKEWKEEMKKEEERKMRMYAEMKERKDWQADRCIMLKKMSKAKREALLIEERDCGLAAEWNEGAEQPLCSFTVIWPRFDCVMPYHRSRIGEPTPQKMKSLFVGLGIGCVVRSVDSPRYVFTVSVPGRGFVLVHRKIDRFCDLELDEDFVFQTVGRSFFGIAKQIRLSPAHLLAIQLPKEKDAAPETRVVLESPELDLQDMPSENKGIKALELAQVMKKEIEKRETETKARFRATRLMRREEEYERKKDGQKIAPTMKIGREEDIERKKRKADIIIHPATEQVEVFGY